MVTFNKKGFVIEFKSSSPVEEWMRLQEHLNHVITSANVRVNECYMAIFLLNELVPSEEFANKMFND